MSTILRGFTGELETELSRAKTLAVFLTIGALAFLFALIFASFAIYMHYAPIYGESATAFSIAGAYALTALVCFAIGWIKNRRAKRRVERQRAQRKVAMQAVVASRLLTKPRTAALLVPIALIGLHLLKGSDEET